MVGGRTFTVVSIHELAECVALAASGSDPTIVYLVHEDWRYIFRFHWRLSMSVKLHARCRMQAKIVQNYVRVLLRTKVKHPRRNSQKQIRLKWPTTCTCAIRMRERVRETSPNGFASQSGLTLNYRNVRSLSPAPKHSDAQT